MNQKIEKEQVKQIRRQFLAGETVANIAEENNMSLSAAYQLCNNESWFDENYHPELRRSDKLSVAQICVANWLTAKWGWTVHDTAKEIERRDGKKVHPNTLRNQLYSFVEHEIIRKRRR